MSISIELFVVGTGGAAVEASWVVRRMSVSGSPLKIIGFADDKAELAGSKFEGIDVVGTPAQIAERFRGQDRYFHCAIGDNRVRAKIGAMLEAAGLIPISLVDPTAVVAPSATIGAGAYIAPFAFVGPHAQVGRHVLINVSASVGHHSVVGDFAQLCPGARVSGKANLGAFAFVGSNGVVSPGVQLGDGATLGACSFAARGIPARATALGVPAKVLAVPPSP